MKTQQLDETAEFVLCKWFSEDISCVLLHGDILHADLLVFHSLVNEVVTNVDLFGACIKFVVL